MFLVHCLQFCLFPPSFCAGYRRMVHILQRNGDESSLFFKCLAAADPMMAAKPKERVSDVVHSSSVPEGHDEREQEHVEAATICKHQAVTLPDCRIKTAKLLLDQKKKKSCLELKHSGNSLKIISILYSLSFQWWQRAFLHHLTRTLQQSTRAVVRRPQTCFLLLPFQIPVLIPMCPN